MATYVTRKGRISVRVVIKPLKPISRTFDTRDEAKEWADAMEAELRHMRDVQGFTAAKIGPELDGRPRTITEIMTLPRIQANEPMSGIYFLFKNDECIYVGQSRQVPVRVREHRTSSGPRRQFDSYSWVRCNPEHLDKLEQWYIELLSPAYNGTWNERGRRKKAVLQEAHIAL